MIVHLLQCDFSSGCGLLPETGEVCWRLVFKLLHYFLCSVITSLHPRDGAGVVSLVEGVYMGVGGLSW